MRKPATILFVFAAGALTAAASIALLTANGSEVRAQTPVAPCTCSRSTPIVGIDEVSAVPGQMQPRFGVTHCQCGPATCVSQASYGSAGMAQLFCVK